MKILILTTRYFPHKGGVENVVENLAQKWGEKHDVCILTSKKSNGMFDVEDAIEKKGNHSVKRIWMALPRSIKGYIAFVVRFFVSIRSLRLFIKIFKPDILNVHFLDDITVYIATLIFLDRDLLKNSKLVVNIHGNDLHIFSRRFGYKYFISYVLNKADCIIVNSTYMKDGLVLQSPELENKIQVVSNGLNIEHLRNIPAKIYMNDDYIFFVGRFVHKKGIDLLIKAFAELDIKDLKLILEGSGETLADMEKLAATLNLGDRIIFTKGNLSHDDKVAFMKGALFGVIPSRIEPFGIVALEFVAGGVPVIVSKTGGLIDLIEDRKTGIFFQNEDLISLKSAMKELYTNKQLRSAISIAQLDAVSGYSWTKIADKYINIFNNSK